MDVDPIYLEYCVRARPNWSPEDGMVSSFLELLIAMNEPLGIGWLAVLTVVLWKRNTLFGALLALLSLWLLADWNLLKYNLDDDLFLGKRGGCVGSLVVTNIVLLTAFLFGALVVFLRWLRSA